MISFYIPFVASATGGDSGADLFRATFPLAAIGMLVLAMSWMIAILQFVWMFGRLVNGSPAWKHHALACLWSFVYLCSWGVLSSKGCYLTM